MDYSFNAGTKTITDLPVVPGTEMGSFDNETRGGGKYPTVRAGVGTKYVCETIIDKTAGAVGLTLADCMTLVNSLDNWTINGVGPGLVDCQVTGDAVQLARITLG